MPAFRRLLAYLRPYLGQMLVAALLLAVAGGLMSVVLATLKPLVNEVLTSPAPVPAAAPAAPTAPVAPVAPAAGEAGEPAAETGFDILAWLQERLPTEAWTTWLRQRAFAAVPLLLVAVFLLRGVLLYFGQYLTTRAGVAVIRNLRADLFEVLVFQSLVFFRAHPTGTVVSRLVSDAQRLQRISTQVLADLVRVSAMVPFLLALVLIHDWRMSLFALIVVPVMAWPMIRLGRRLRRASHRSQQEMAEVADRVTETVAGIKVIQAFGMERFQIGRFHATLKRMLRVDLKAGRAAALSSPVVELIGAVAGAALFYVAGRAIARGSLDPGDFAVVVGGLGLLFMSVRRLNQVNVEIQQALAAAERVFEVLDWGRDVEDAPGARELAPMEDRVRYEGVCFGYEGEEGETVLHGIDLKIRRGEMVALVGPSGSGKTTLANLLLRFYDPTGGRITVDGNDLREVTLASLRAQIGIVSQETVLFDDTVTVNLTCGRPDVPFERVVAAARAAHAHEFVEQLPEGYDTRLGELGMRLSAGQRQRLAIARALLADPRILVLDEATSALDAESEALVQEALAALLEGRASLVIAHRLATVRMADRILAMEAGRIVEEGTHEELLAHDGLYARLHRLQFQG